MSISVIQWNSLQFGRSFMVEPRTEHQHQNDQRLWRNTKQKKTKTKKEKKNNKNLPANISASRSWLRCVLAILVIFTNALRIAMAGLGWVSAATRDKIKVIIFEILFDVCICGMLMFCVDLKNTEYINNNQIYFIIIIKERNRRTKRGQIMQTPHAGDLCCELMGPRQQHANRNAMQSIYIYIYFWMTSDPIDNTRNMSALIWWRLDGWIAQVCNHQKIEKKKWTKNGSIEYIELNFHCFSRRWFSMPMLLLNYRIWTSIDYDYIYYIRIRIEPQCAAHIKIEIT